MFNLTCCFNDSMAFSMFSACGGSINGNSRALGNPMATIWSSNASRGTFCNSGVLYSAMASNSSSEYKR